MRIVIIGASGFALEAACLAEDCGYEVVGFLDDSPEMQGLRILGKPVLGHIGRWVKYVDHSFVVAVGAPRVRKRIVERMTTEGKPNFATLVHPSVLASKYIALGEGSLICAGCILTVDIKIGKHCIINLNTTIGHEVCIADFCTVAPIVAISGNVIIEDLVEVGTGASIRQGVNLGKGAMLGMGSVLTKDCISCKVYAGVPAKQISSLEDV